MIIIEHYYFSIYKNRDLKIFFRYDTDEEGVVLRFIGVKRLHIATVDYYNQWLLGSRIMLTSDNTLLWCDADDKTNIDEIVGNKDINWVEADEIWFAWLDKNNEICPLSEEQINPVWLVMNFKTGKYEDFPKNFKVYPVSDE